MRIFAIDPGTTESGWCLLSGGRVEDSGVHPNHDVLRWIQAGQDADMLAIEMIAGMGMTVGQTTFETVRWIGRFQQAWREPEAVHLVYRRQVKTFLCGNQQAKDANVRQALIDLFPPLGGGSTPQIGTKRLPGPLLGVSSHAWSALAVAMTVAGTKRLTGVLPDNHAIYSEADRLGLTSLSSKTDISSADWNDACNGLGTQGRRT